MKLIQNILRHRSKRRRLKANLPLNLQTDQDGLTTEFLRQLVRAWESLHDSGIRIGRGDLWRHVPFELVAALPPPSQKTALSTVNVKKKSRKKETHDDSCQAKFRFHDSKESSLSQMTPDISHPQLSDSLCRNRANSSAQIIEILRAGRTVLRKYKRHQRFIFNPHSTLIPGSSVPVTVTGSTVEPKKLGARLVFDTRALNLDYQKALKKRLIRDIDVVKHQIPKSQPRLFMHSSSVWQTLTGHDKDFQKVPRFEWQALLGIASAGRRGILQPALCRLTGQDKRSLPRRTTQLAKKGYITKRSVLKQGSRTSKMWLKRFAPALLDSNPIDISRVALSGNTDCVPWHNRWTGQTIDYLALGQTTLAVLKAYGVMKHLDLKRKMGVVDSRWHMKVLARTLRYWGSCGVIKYVAASLEGNIFRDCLKFERQPTGEEWQRYLATGGLSKRPSRSRRAAAQEAAVEEAIAKIQIQPIQEMAPEPAWKWTNFSEWIPERPIIFTVYTAIRKAGEQGITNRGISKAVLSRDFQRLFSRLALAITSHPPPKHLKHLMAVHRKQRSGKVLQYHYFEAQCFRKKIKKENRWGPSSQPGPERIRKKDICFKPELFSRHRPQLTVEEPATLTDLVLHGQRGNKPQRKQAKKGIKAMVRKGRPPTKVSQAKPAINLAASKNHISQKSAPAISAKEKKAMGHEIAAKQSIIVSQVQPETSLEDKRTESPDSPKIDSSQTTENGITTALVDGNAVLKPPGTPLRNPVLEKVYFAEKNSLEPTRSTKKKGRPKKSVVVVFNLNAFSQEYRQRLDIGEQTSPAAESLGPSPPNLTVRPKENQLGDPEKDAEVQVQEESQVKYGAIETVIFHPDATIPPSNKSTLKSSVTAKGENGKGAKGKKNIRSGGWVCEKCGQSWKNDNGLSYHLTKSRTECNPNYDPNAVLPLPRTRPSPEIASPQLATEVKADLVLSTSTGRPIRAARRRQPLQEALPDLRDSETETRPASKREAVSSRKPKKNPHISPATRSDHNERPPTQYKRYPKKRQPVSLSLTHPAIAKLANQTFPTKTVVSRAVTDLSITSRSPDVGVAAIADSHLQSTRVFDQSFNKPLLPSLSKQEFSKQGARLIENTRKHVAKKNHVSRPPTYSPSVLPTESRLQRAEASSFTQSVDVSVLKNDTTAETAYGPVKISGLSLGGPCFDDGNTVVPGEVEGFVPAEFNPDVYIEELEFLQRKPIYFWIRMILAHLCKQNGGVFPGDKAAYLAVLRVWHQHLDQYTPPKERTVKRVLYDRDWDGPEILHLNFQEVHRRRWPITLQIIYLPGVDTRGNLANLIKRRIFRAYPSIYLPKAFAPTSEEFSSLGMVFEETRGQPKTGRAGRKIAPEIEVLEAPFYLVEARLGGSKRPVNRPSTPRPTKRRRLVEAGVRHGLHGRPRDRTWSLLERPVPQMQNFETGAWDRDPKPSYIQRWPVTLVKKPHQSSRLANPGLDSLPNHFWIGPLVNSLPASVPASLEDVLIRLSYLEMEEKQSLHDIQRVKEWELSIEGQEFALTENVLPGSCFVNIFTGQFNVASRSAGYRSVQWDKQGQLNMYTLNYPVCDAVSRAPEVKSEFISTFHFEAHRPTLDVSLNRKKKKDSQAKLRPAREPKPTAVVQVVEDVQRQRLTQLPRTKHDFLPKLGFFGLKSGPNATLTPEAQRLVITAFVCVSCLAGGVSKTVDYGLMMRLFPEFTSTSLSKFWLRARKERGSHIQRLMDKFEEEFLEAYRRKQVPPLNSQDLLAYDWKWLLKWAMTLDLHEEEQDLPDSRADLLATKEARDTSNPDIDWRDKFYQRQGSSFSRMKAFSQMVPAKPVNYLPEFEDLVLLSKARSYIKSLCCLPVQQKYTSHEIKNKLLTLVPGAGRQIITRLLQKAAVGLNSQKVIIKGNANQDPVAGSFRMHGTFMKQFDRRCKLDRFEQAVEFKGKLDTAFETGQRVRLRYTAGEGDIMAILNMHAAGRLRLEGVDVPNIPMGFMPGYYESRKFNTWENLNWRVEICPTDEWIYDKNISQLDISAIYSIPGLGPQGQVPMWRNIFGDPDVDMWLKTLAYTIFLIATKGPWSTASEMCRMAKPFLEPFEADLVFDWAMKVGIVRPSPGSTGYTTAEWWWWAVGKAKFFHCSDKEIVERNRIKHEGEQPKRAPRRRHATIAVRHAVREAALLQKKEEKKRKKKRLKDRGQATRTVNRAMLQGPAAKLFYKDGAPQLEGPAVAQTLRETITDEMHRSFEPIETPYAYPHPSSMANINESMDEEEDVVDPALRQMADGNNYSEDKMIIDPTL